LPHRGEHQPRQQQPRNRARGAGRDREVAGVGSGGEEEKIAKDARDKANAMTPQPKISAAKAAGLLRQMATSIEMSKKPDPKLLIQDVKRFLTEIGG